MEMTRGFFFPIMLLILVCVADVPAAQALCAYKLIIKTGDKVNAGTGSRINLVLGNNTSGLFRINNLPNYGILGPNYNYFGRDKTAVFFFYGPCDLRCRVTLEFNSSGVAPGWYVDFFILIASFPPTCDHTGRFPVNKWFGGSYDNFVVDFCRGAIEMGKHNQTAASLVGKLAMPS